MLKCLYADRKQQRLGPEHDRSGNAHAIIQGRDTRNHGRDGLEFNVVAIFRRMSASFSFEGLDS